MTRRAVDPAVRGTYGRSLMPGVTNVFFVVELDKPAAASCTDEADVVCVNAGRTVAVCVWPVVVLIDIYNHMISY